MSKNQCALNGVLNSYDDANQTTSLEYILNYVTAISNNDIKIVMTVRDYAKHRVESIVRQYVIPQEIVIKVLKDEEIKDILKRKIRDSGSVMATTCQKKTILFFFNMQFHSNTAHTYLFLL